MAAVLVVDVADEDVGAEEEVAVEEAVLLEDVEDAAEAL